MVSLALVIVGMVLLSLSVLIVGWVLIPSYLRVLRWWADLARTRSARYSGSAVPHRYPPMPANPGIGDLRRLLTDRSTRRDGGWLVLHAMGAPVAGLLTVALPLGALNTFAVPFYWQAMPADEPVSNPYPVTSWWGQLACPSSALCICCWRGG